MLRAVALSLIVLFSIAITVPLTNSSAHTRRAAATRRYRHHSRAWWRRHRARMRRMAARREGKDVAAMRNHNSDEPAEVGGQSNFFTAKSGTYTEPHGQLSLTMPNGWTSRPALVNGEMQFRVYTPD